MQGHVYWLTVATEETAIRLHGRQRRRRAAAERAPGSSCAQMFACCGWKPDRAGSLCSPLQRSPTSVPFPLAAKISSLWLLIYFSAASTHPVHWLKPNAEPQRRARPGSSPLNLAVIAAQPPAPAALSCASVLLLSPTRSASFLYAFQKTPSAQKDPAVCKSKGRAQSWRQCLGWKGLCALLGTYFTTRQTAAKQQVRNRQHRAVTTNTRRAGA